MEALKSVDTLLLFALIFVPGFISIKAYDLIYPGAQRKMSENALDAISYGCINLVVFWWPLAFIYKAGWVASHPLRFYLALLLMFLVMPFLWPVLIRYLHGTWIGRLLFMDPTPAAWDAYFGLKEACWILIRLKNGESIGGWYSVKSYASAYPEKDLYIEQVWKRNAEGQFEEKINQTKGMWISKDSIEYLEFFDSEGSNDDDKKQR